MTWFVKDESRHLVLRHYYRGGMVGKLVRDRFWFEGVESSRAMAEYRLLATLSEQGLPVPRPVRGAHGQTGPFYRADILIERIRGAKDLVALLKQGPIAGEVWHKIGKTVRQLHDAGVYHADLNSHNLLLDKGGQGVGDRLRQGGDPLPRQLAAGQSGAVAALLQQGVPAAYQFPLRAGELA